MGPYGTSLCITYQILEYSKHAQSSTSSRPLAIPCRQRSYFHQTSITNALGLSTSSRTELVWLFHASYTATTGAPYVHHARAHCPTHHVLWSFCRSSIFHLRTLHQNIFRVSARSGFSSSPRGWWPNCTVRVLVQLIPMPISTSFCLYHTSSHLAAIKSLHQSSAQVRSRFSLYVVFQTMHAGMCILSMPIDGSASSVLYVNCALSHRHEI